MHENKKNLKMKKRGVYFCSMMPQKKRRRLFVEGNFQIFFVTYDLWNIWKNNSSTPNIRNCSHKIFLAYEELKLLYNRINKVHITTVAQNNLKSLKN